MMQRLGDVTLINTELNFSNHKDYAKIIVTPSESLTAVRINQKRDTNIIRSGMVANFVENKLNLQFAMIDVDNETDDFSNKLIDHIFKDFPSHLDQGCNKDHCRLCFTKKQTYYII